MRIEQFNDVILTADVPEHELRVGDVGTVVEQHQAPGHEAGFSVEFFDMTGRTLVVVTLPGSKLRAPTPFDRPAVRNPTHAAP